VAEPFKNLINPVLVQRAAAHLARAEPAFDAGRFVRQACDGLEALEMKARAMQIAEALEATLPADFVRAAAAIEAALAPAPDHERLGELVLSDEGLAGWILWPVGEFVARRGLAQPERALTTLAEITQRFTAEFAIRPFIVAHPALVFETLARWVRDPSAHVRRLVSEGSRPRLPWGLQLKALIADPSPALPLLAALQDDPSEYVRRSVANHLNDIAKDHPALVVDWVERHLPGASAERRALLRHASRTLVKRGDRRALAAWGLGKAFQGEAQLTVAPRRARVGEGLTLALALTSRAARAQTLAIDYLVHHVKADGATSAKVFKGWVTTLPARGSVQLVKSHSLRPVTTRRYHAGRHVVEVQINGRIVAADEFMLVVPAGMAGGARR
jgi:3-methyladenine DNA glycosylase AlkC